MHFILLFLIHLIISPVYAATPLQFQEDFSHGFSQWEAARGDLSLWSVEGEKAKATVRTQSTLTEIVPRDQFWNPNWHNITYQFEYTPIQGTDRNLSFGYQNTLNWYDLHFVDNFYELARVQNGVVTFDTFALYTLRNGRSYQMRLVLKDGHIQFFIDGELIIDKVDWTFNQNFGKISLKATAGSIAPTIVQFDNISVKPLLNPGEIQLFAPLIKQTDLQWQHLEYDRAHEWAADDPSIKRWGCALTAAVMIMQYHGLNQFPDGTNITPATLNNWLNQQADGYFNGGNVNWNAITRLTKLIHDHFGTIKLEYSYIKEDLEQAKAEIMANRPVILEIPGHFMVADGLSGDHQVVSIEDPAYSFTQFDQHNAKLLSVRKFLPSFTDLSAVVISAPLNTEVVLTNTSNQPLPELQTSTHFLKDPSQPSAQKSPEMQYFLLSKPIEADYKLKIKKLPSSPPASSVVQIFAYDKEANLSDLTQSLASNSDSQDLIIHYHSNSSSTISPIIAFEHFRQDLYTEHQAKRIRSSYAFFKIDRIAAFAESIPVEQAKRYIAPLQVLLNRFQESMASTTYQLLQQDLRTISPAGPAELGYVP